MMGFTLRQMFHSRFLAAEDFEGKDVTLTIAELKRVSLEREGAPAEVAWTIVFKEKRRTGEPSILVLNRTNATLIFAMWPDTDQWPGKRITLTPERDNSPVNETGWCIRIKGSPDIAASVNVTIKLPRRKPVARKLCKTTPGQQDQPAFDADTGEVIPVKPDYANMEYPAGLLDDPRGGPRDMGEEQ
jgi:hypothetical protein